MKKLQKATHSGVLKIGQFEIPCFVLDNGTRVITQRGLAGTLNLKTSGGLNIGDLLKRISDKGLEANDLINALNSPALFTSPRGGKTNYGFEATVLVDICDFYLTARKNSMLSTARQKLTADHCEILTRAFAKVGIIALVDEATGYQEIRDKEALQKILDKYLLADYAKWAKRFPDEFYKEMFRLKKWQWDGMSIKRPGVIGKYTNDLVYERLAPGVLKELQERNPITENGHRKSKHHQWLTDDIGIPALSQHIHTLIAFMRASSNWDQFHRLVERSFTKFGETIPLQFEDE
jgi:hypothetical protein